MACLYFCAYCLVIISNRFHPKHTLKNIPYVLARRIKHIVSDETIRDRRWSDLRSRLSRLKYPMALINDAIRRATEDPADRPITNTQEQETKTIIPLFKHSIRIIQQSLMTCYTLLPVALLLWTFLRSVALEELIDSRALCYRYLIKIIG